MSSTIRAMPGLHLGRGFGTQTAASAAARVIPLLLCGLWCLAGPRIAHAQDGDSIALGLFTEGRALYEQGQYDEACAKFQESYRLKPALGARLNLALCEEARGRIATAWALYRQLVDKFDRDDPRYAFARERLEELEPQVPKVVIELQAEAPAETIAKLGDIELTGASFGTALALDPGEHVVMVGAPGHEEARFSVTARRGETVTLGVAPGSTPSLAAETHEPLAAAPQPDTTPTSIWTPLRIAALTTAGVGVVALGLSGLFAARALHHDSASDADCRDNVCGPEGRAARDAARRHGQRATVATIAGGALLSGAAVLWFVGKPQPGEVRPSVAVNSSGAELLLQGAF